MKLTNRALFIKNSIYNTSFKLINQIIAIVIIPLFVKNLGANLYGIWVISGIIVGYLGFVDFGFSNGLTRYIAEAYTKRDTIKFNKLVNTGIGILFIIGFIICIIIFFSHEYIIKIFKISPDRVNIAQKLLLIAGVFSITAWPMRITNLVFEGILRYKELSILNGIRSLGETLLMIFLIYNTYDIVSIAVLINVARVILWIPAFVVMKKILSMLSFNFKYFQLGTIREISSFSLGLFYSNILSLLANSIDRIIIGITISMQAVTAYTVASKIFFVSAQYIGFLSGVLIPTIYKIGALGDKSLLEKILNQGTKYQAMIVSPVGYLGLIVSPLFIKLWMGQEYVQYAIWSQIFMAGFLFGPGFGMPATIALSLGKMKKVNRNRTIQTIFNVILSILLVKRFGIGGPIVATILTGTMLGPVLFPYYCNIIEVKWNKSFVTVYKVVFTNLPVCILFYWLINALAISSWIGLIIFSILMLIIQYSILYIVFFTKEEKNDLMVMLDTIGLAKLIKIKG